MKCFLWGVWGIIIVDSIEGFARLSQRTRSNRFTSLDALAANYTAFHIMQGLETTDVALTHFLDTVKHLQSEGREIRVVSEVSPERDNKDALSINALVVQTTSEAANVTKDYILVVLPSTDCVKWASLEDVVIGLGYVEANERKPFLRLAESEDVESLCGFKPGTVPPLGLFPAPLLTVVDNQLLRSARSLLLGGGGRLGLSTYMSIETLLLLSNTHAGSLCEGSLAPDGEGNAELRGVPVPSVDNGLELIGYKPFFPLEPPDEATAQQVVQNPNLRNPLQQTAITFAAQIVSVRRMARNLVFCNLAPFQSERTHLTDTRESHSWRSGVDGGDMAVQLIAGETFCQRHGRSTERDSAPFRRLKIGQALLVHARTNVGNRESLRNWLKKRNLDVVLLDYHIVQESRFDSIFFSRPSDNSLARSFANTQSTILRRQPLTLTLPLLSIAETYGGSFASHVFIVNDLSSIERFEADVALLSRNVSDSKLSMVGLDCEWRPSCYAEKKDDDQPVLLLQLCLHELKRIYLLDLQALLRPLQLSDATMINVEERISKSVGDLFQSVKIAKVGFQVVQDLRRLAASYPHVPAFQLVHCVMEASTLGKKVMYLNNERHSRLATSSLARLTEKVLGRTLNKNEQVSDWALRPLTPEQQDYAALDALATPLIIEELLGRAKLQLIEKPQIGRWINDSSFKELIKSWRFLLIPFQEAVSTHKFAKRIVGPSLIISQNWITGDPEPALPSSARDESGRYTDLNGVRRIPSNIVALKDNVVHGLIDDLLGCSIGRSKDRCITRFLQGATSIANGEKLDYTTRSGYIEFQNAVVLFINTPQRNGGLRSAYPNEWLEEGQLLSWFLRPDDWQDGLSSVAQKLLASSERSSTFVILFVRTGQGHFLCCGRCLVMPFHPSTSLQTQEGRHLVKLFIKLLDWKRLSCFADFQAFIHLGKPPRDDGFLSLDGGDDTLVNSMP